MPARGDHDARRRDVSEAVWRVLATHGFGGLTLRAVAAELGASTGLVSHYFPTKQALVRHAHDVAEERTAHRPLHVPTAPGLPALRAALLDVLPLTPELIAMSRTWVSFWDAALGDPELGARQTARYARWRAALRVHVEAARQGGELAYSVGAKSQTEKDTKKEIDDVVATVAAFAHGLVVQALFDAERFPAARQIQLLDEFLARFTAVSPIPGQTGETPVCPTTSP